MDSLDTICDAIREDFDRRTKVRDEALAQARQLTKHASLAIRAIHREEEGEAFEQLQAAKSIVQVSEAMNQNRSPKPDF